jgi:hypothetical protein
LAPLSKCSNLRSLDLALCKGDIKFTALIKAVRKLEKLISLRLPQPFQFDDAYPIMKRSNFTENIWPPHLQHLEFRGNFSSLHLDPDPDFDFFKSFHWPDSLTCLTINTNDDWDRFKINLMLQNSQLSNYLRSLTIYPDHHDSLCKSSVWIDRILTFLPRLRFLSLQACTFDDQYNTAIDNDIDSDPPIISLVSPSSVHLHECHSLEVLELHSCIYPSKTYTRFLNLLRELIMSYADPNEYREYPPPLAMLRAIGLHDTSPSVKGANKEVVLGLHHALRVLNLAREVRQRKWLGTETSSSLPNSHSARHGAQGEDSKEYAYEDARNPVRERTESMFVCDEDRLENMEWTYKHRYTGEGIGPNDGGYVGVYFLEPNNGSTRRFGKGNLIW